MNHSDFGVLGMYWYCREKFCLGQLWESKGLLNMLSHKAGLDKLKGNHWLLSTEVVNYLYHTSSDKCPDACSNFWLKRRAVLLKIGHFIKVGCLFIIIHFLQTHPDNLTIIEITGTQRLENGLVGPGKFIAFTNSAAIGTKIKRTAGTWR